MRAIPDYRNPVIYLFNFLQNMRYIQLNILGLIIPTIKTIPMIRSTLIRHFHLF